MTKRSFITNYAGTSRGIGPRSAKVAKKVLVIDEAQAKGVAKILRDAARKRKLKQELIEAYAESTQGRPVFGAYKGKFSVGPEFFEPLPAEELKAWSEE